MGKLQREQIYKMCTVTVTTRSLNTRLKGRYKVHFTDYPVTHSK